MPPDGWIKMMTSTHSAEYYSAMTKKGILTLVTTWITGGCHAGGNKPDAEGQILSADWKKPREVREAEPGAAEGGSRELLAKDTKLQFYGMSKFWWCNVGMVTAINDHVSYIWTLSRAPVFLPCRHRKQQCEGMAISMRVTALMCVLKCICMP